MWDVGGLEVHGTFNRRQMFSEVFEARSTIKNLTCGGDLEISLGVIRL